MNENEWSIQEVARLAGTTSRTLRHYDDVGVLHPSRIGSNGYRYYDEPALATLQRILLLRELGLGLPAIAEVLAGQGDNVRALAHHVHWLREEKNRLDRQIASVEITISKMKGGEQLMAEEMFDGFDNTTYKEEVEQRWGADAYAQGNDWFTTMSAEDRAEWMQRQKQLAADWAAAAVAGLEPAGAEAQSLARRQADWLGAIPGTPRNGTAPTKEYFLGLGDLYVADDRFAANYGGTAGAEFVRDAMRVFAAHAL
jgi:DNA-binding transcriptional MerR regulator